MPDLTSSAPSTDADLLPLPPSGRPVTIGMPVYNGERHIEQAIDSILAQTFTDFRLLILDNASTDGTARIAQHYAEIDPRVVYRRNSRNIGAAPNFNRAFELSDSPYFKWAAHDDELQPTYLEACVRALDADPDASVAHTLVDEIDDVGATLRIYDPLPEGMADADRLTRFRARALYRGGCTEIFGLIRADKLRRTPLMRGYGPADLSILIELSLSGPFALVREPLFRNRRHDRRYTAAVFEKGIDGVDRGAIAAWYDTRRRTQWWSDLHWWRFFITHFSIIDRTIPRLQDRLPYYLVALRWATMRNNAVDLSKDLLCLASPTLLAWTVRTHRRLAGANPPSVANTGGH